MFRRRKAGTVTKASDVALQLCDPVSKARRALVEVLCQGLGLPALLRMASLSAFDDGGVSVFLKAACSV